MRSAEHAEMLREVGLVPTIQRLAVLHSLTNSKLHPTADQVHAAVRKRFPSISRATVYNTLDALTRAGMALRLNIDPAVARYDADLGPHAHFRCRVCQKVYDIVVKERKPIDVSTDGHLVESVRTYAYGICASCRKRSVQPKESKTRSSSAPPSREPSRKKESQTPSSPGPSPSTGKEGTHNA